MKISVLATITAVLAVIATGLWFRQQSSFQPITTNPLVGEAVLPVDIVKQASRIVIRSEDAEPVVLEMHSGGYWYLPECFGLPVDFDQLSRFIQGLVDAKIRRAVTSNPERFEAMNLGETTVTITSGGKDWLLEIGENPERGGTFFKLGSEETVFLSSVRLKVDATSANWLQKQVFEFAAEDVASVTFDYAEADGSITFAREDKDADFTAEGLAEGESVKQSEVSRILRSLTGVRFNEALEPGDSDAVDARANEHDVVLELFDGQRYTLSIGRRPAMPIEVEPSEAPESDEEAAEPEEPEMTEPGPTFIRFASTDAQFPFNGLQEKVALQYAGYIFTQLPTDRAALIEQPDAAEEAVSEPSPDADS